MTSELVLPSSVRPDTWNADTAAMMEFAGLTWLEQRPNPENPGTPKTVRMYAPSGIMAGFIAACARTGLDPTTRQIYAAIMSGKWTVLVGVDGMRVVAQRSREYQGQTPVQWTRDGVTWVDAWLPELQGGAKDEKPAAARVGILRQGFREPLFQVVTWKEFGMEPRFKGDNWGVRPAHMLGIRAETHALRRAFPNDLSGLYTAEDFDTDTVDTSDAPSAAVEYSEDWFGLFAAATTRDELEDVRKRIPEKEKSDKLRTAFLARAGYLSREAARTEDADVVTDDPQTADEGAQAPHPDVEAPQAPSAPAPSSAATALTEEEYETAEAARYDAAVAAGEVSNGD